MNNFTTKSLFLCSIDCYWATNAQNMFSSVIGNIAQ